MKDKPIIHIGDGRHIRLGEGVLKLPPKNKSRPGPRKYTSPPYVKPTFARPNSRGENNWQHKAYNIPGFREWKIYMHSMVNKYSQGGRRVGEAPGIRRGLHGYLMGHVKRKVKIDMENIKRVTPDLNEVAAEALEGALTVLRGPQSQQQKLAAAKLLLDFSMSKPVAKSQVSVNAAEDWLASLADKEDSEDNS